MQCRVCMQTECRILLDMTVACTNDGKSLFDYFKECTQLNASANDSFPKTLCKICAQKLHMAYNFRKRARQSHADFKKLLNLQKIQTESIIISTNESFNFMDMEETTVDPLDMKFNEVLKIANKPDLEYLEEMERNRELKAALKEKVDLDDNDLCEIYTSVTSQTRTSNDPLGMKFNEAVKALTNPDLKYLDDEGTVDVKQNMDLDVNELCEISTSFQPQTYMFKEESDLSIEKFVIETDPTEKLCYACALCDFTFESESELIKHTSELHSSEIMCVICSKCFNMPDELSVHKKLIHETDSAIHCDYCKETPLIAREELNEHFQSKHKSYYFKYFPPTCYKCTYCRNMYSSASELEDHVKTHDILKCPFCSKSYGNIRSYKTHIMHKHNISLIESKEEQEVQIDDHSVDSLVCYVRKENKGKRNKTAKYNLKKKCTEAEEEQQESHEKCTYKNANSSKIKEKPRYLCSFCPRVLSTKSSMEAHERKQHLHIKTDLENCPHCEKKVGRQYLKKHIKLVHLGERKFNCDICGDSYKTHDTLNRHKQLHKKERNFPCTICDRSFPYNSELKVHMRLHTGEMPFVCHLCDRRFRIRVHLTYHLQTHAKIMLKCKVCDKGFRNAKSLRIHSFEHTGIMPYKCLVCNYGSVKRDYFIRHMLSKHDTTLTADELFAMFKANTGRSPRVKLTEELTVMNEKVQEGDSSP